MTAKKNTPPSKPEKYGRYEVLKLIGEGAMGKVFLASDPVLKRQVAIKIVSVDKQLDEKIRKEFLKRFAIEARLSAQLSHPSIVPVYDAGEEDGVPWIAFQYVEGIVLDKLIKNHEKLPVKVAVSIATNIASALQQAHKINVVHRDIKPSNIIIDRHGGIAKLTDFGVAKSPLASLTMEGNTMGSPGYMSPEQIEGRELDHRSDLFSLGVVLYEMLTGRHPFKRDSITTTAYATISGKYTPAKLIIKEIPARLENIISQCLMPDIDKRITDAAHLVALLGTISSKARFGVENKRRIISLTTGIGAVARQGWSIVRNSHAAAMSALKKRPAPGALYETGTVALTKRARGFSRRVLSGIDGFVLKNPARAKAAGTGILVIAGVLALMMLLGPIVFQPPKIKLWLPEKGMSASDLALLAEFKTFFSDGDLDSAASRAALLALTENSAATGQFLQGLVACRKKEFDEASVAFEASAGMKDGKECIRRNAHYMVVRYALVNERMPDKLVDILTRDFDAAYDRSVQKAVKEKPYWPRWNALRILQAGNRKIDLVGICILDLRHAEERRIRAQAIRDLGDMGDRRAIPALREAKKQKKKDPVISSAASKVLKKVFKVK